jgi:hypothetical protein
VIQAYFIQAGPGHLVWALGALVIAARNARTRGLPDPVPAPAGA